MSGCGDRRIGRAGAAWVVQARRWATHVGRIVALAGVSMLVVACTAACTGAGDAGSGATPTSSPLVATSIDPGRQLDPSPTPPNGAAAAELDQAPPETQPVETGVPGLDSTDALCSAWSRFAGSFQVVAVASAFAEAPPAQLAALEVIAAPTVVEAFDELFANWPAALEPEREVVADSYLGPFQRRMATASSALVAAGAAGGDIDTISAAWLAALAARDPTTPEFAVDLPDQLWELVDLAAAELATAVVPFGQDPSLVTQAATPLTDAYLAATCPDQGALAGQDVGPGADGDGV